ncbi:MAG: hypothetical protein HOE92_00110 [Euryarchaeota archaeon]|nr:hypothetical protein [Euryarchaeota archaeon]MBT3970604.1 hypothetical protein [Euryarchaeota archaeon]MBT4408115.1 hypothetical protein [Euryarchaeota archaeon]MBT6645021.1 hypothetical protein [Euryarchaeota archaeon]
MVGKSRAVAYKINTEQLIRALFEATSDEATLLNLAACGEIDLVAEGKSWNAFLWLMLNTFQGVWTPLQLGEMKDSLPIKFR